MDTIQDQNKFCWLRQKLTGHSVNLELMHKIVDFVLFERPINIEKLRKSLHHQVFILMKTSACERQFLHKMINHLRLNMHII